MTSRCRRFLRWHFIYYCTQPLLAAIAIYAGLPISCAWKILYISRSQHFAEKFRMIYFVNMCLAFSRPYLRSFVTFTSFKLRPHQRLRPIIIIYTYRSHFSPYAATIYKSHFILHICFALSLLTRISRRNIAAFIMLHFRASQYFYIHAAFHIFDIADYRRGLVIIGSEQRFTMGIEIHWLLSRALISFSFTNYIHYSRLLGSLNFFYEQQASSHAFTPSAIYISRTLNTPEKRFYFIVIYALFSLQPMEAPDIECLSRFLITTIAER